MKKDTELYDKIFKTAMATAMATSALAVTAPDVSKANTDEDVFKDVKTTSDYYEYVNELFERGFVSGYPDGSYKPNGLLTRAHAAKILALNLGLDVTTDYQISFSDVSKGDWYYPYIAALRENGIIDGFEDGTFRPNTPITRNQMAKILVNGYGLQPTSTITLPFEDISSSHWAAPYIQTLFDLGVTIGQTDTSYGGGDTVTRANMAAFTIRAEKTTNYRDNRKPDANVISSIEDNKITIDGQVYYIAKELQPLLHERNLTVLNDANLDFVKIGTKVVGINNVELLNSGTAEKPLTLDLNGGTVEANITIAGDYINLANSNITGDITIKTGDQKQIEFNSLNLNGRLIVEGEENREQDSVIKLTNTTTGEIVVNRDKTKIITDNSTPSINVGGNVSEIEVAGKINAINFNGDQDVKVNGTLETNELTIETPIDVTLANKTHIQQVEVQQYDGTLIVPQDTTIDTLVKPKNISTSEAVKYPTGGSPSIGNVTDISDVTRPSTGGGSSGGGRDKDNDSSDRFTSKTITANNVVDAENADPLAVGMVGTTVTSDSANVAIAELKDGKINIVSKGPGTAIITVKEDAPSVREAQIIVTVDSNGNITHKIKRPVEVVQDKINAEPTPAAEDLLKLYDAIGLKGITADNVDNVTAAVKAAIKDKGKALTEDELKLTVDVALLPESIKKDNPSLQQVSTPLDLITAGPNGTVFDWVSATPVGDHSASINLENGEVILDNADNVSDQIKLGVKASNGTATKDASIDTVILGAEPQLLTVNNVIDAENADPLAVGMIGTTVTSSNENVATAEIIDGKINITVNVAGTAVITVKEDAPSVKEAQIIVTMDARGNITHTIKRPIEVVQDKVSAEPAPTAEDLLKLYEAVDLKGITADNVDNVTAAVKAAIKDKGEALTEDELKLTVDVALLPETIKKDNPSLQQVSTPLDLVTSGPNGTSFKWNSATKVGEHNASIDIGSGVVTQDSADNNNDQITLNVTATNGSATKDATIDTTIVEANKPYLVSATLNDVDLDGDTSAGDSITFVFSEPVVYSGTTEDHQIDEHLFGQDFVFGMGDDAYPIKATWSDDRTTLTMTIGGDTSSPNVFKVGSAISLVEGSVKDANGGESITNPVTLQLEPYEYTIVTPNLTGDFHYVDGTIVSEAAEKVASAITVSRYGVPVEGVEFSYGADDVASGTIASGTFTLKSVNVTKNGKTEKVTFANGETLNVSTTTILRVNDGAEVANGVNHSHVVNGLVKIITVDDSVTDTISVPKVTLANPVIIDGQNKLVFSGGLGVTATQNEVLLKNLMVTGGFSGAQNGDRGPVYISGSAKVTFEHATVDAPASGGYGYSAVLLKNANAKLVIKDSNISVHFAKADNPAYSAYGIRADAAGASIDIINSTVSSNGANGGSRTIQTAQGATVNITDSKIDVEVSTYTDVVYGIRLGDGSSLTLNGTNEISVTAPSADGFGIGNNVNYSNLNVSDTTVFDIDAAASGKRKAPYEFDPESLAALDNAWAKIDENLIKANNPSLQEVMEALSLPTDVDGVSVSWAANTVDGATINANGTVIRSNNDDADDVVTLTATLTHNGMTKTKDFQVTIKENKVPTIALATLVDSNSDGKASMGESVELTFSEPLTFSELFIGDQEFNLESGVWSEDKKKLTVTLQNDITTADTVTVKVNNLVDAANNSIDESLEELIVPSAVEAFKVSDVTITQNGAEPITVTQQGIYKFSVDINLTTNGEGFALDGVYVAQVSGGVMKKIETGTAIEKYDTVLELGGSPYTVVTVTEKVASGKDPVMTRSIRYPGNTYKAEIIQPSLIPSEGSEQIASFTISDVIELTGTSTRNQSVAITVGGEEIEKVVTLSSGMTATDLASTIATVFSNEFEGFSISADGADVILTANEKTSDVAISVQLK
ncbi:S-layer homology domain-containing protein [Lysinibacillus telephonicus]|uniref:S-layer homology domain-containing protein n=1 Tax=Lysinibacillus telephonicus TaxID=1714840 RepID=UPI0031FD9551